MEATLERRTGLKYSLMFKVVADNTEAGNDMLLLFALLKLFFYYSISTVIHTVTVMSLHFLFMRFDSL